MKALLVILNKDNASGLRKCLESAVNMDGFCKLFHILIMDGGSKDNSREVAEEFRKKYGCITFSVQKVLGGTGYARNEACMYAIENGYDAIIWGDSENIYEKHYAKRLLKKLEHADVVGGVPVVRGSFYGHAFAWYHAIHLVFPGLYKIHIPGNNRGEKVEICKSFKYPNTVRGEDYGLSLLLRERGIKLRQDVAHDAIVQVSLPESIKDIIQWQNLRAKGAAQALKKVRAKPYDSLAWSISLLLFPIFCLLSIFTIIPIIIYTLLYFSASLWVFLRSAKFIKERKDIYFFAPFFGLLVHSYYSLKTLIYYLSSK